MLRCNTPTRNALPLLAVPFLLSGCYSEGGPGWSADQHTYISTVHRPITMTLRDTRTSQDFWSVDVPVGRQLVVDFEPGDGPNDYTPDLMYWGIMPVGKTGGGLTNSLPVPNSAGRRLDYTLRPSPELPTDSFDEPDNRAPLIAPNDPPTLSLP